MNYLNRFLIEEDTQFECAGVVDCYSSRVYDTEFSNSARENLKKNFKKIFNWSNTESIGHLVFSGDFYTKFREYADDYIPRLQGLSFLITCTGSERLECIQKDQYEKFYIDGGQITSFLRTNPYCGTTKRIFTVKRDRYISDYPSQHKFEVHKSFGDDIEDFYDGIKKNEVTCKNGREKHTGFWKLLRGWDFEEKLLGGNLTVKTFHLSMLSETEEHEMCSSVSNFYQDTGYKIFDYFKSETALSKNMQNYAFSLCARKTSYCELNELGEPTLWDIKETDPWQENIKKNFQEFKSGKRRCYQDEVPLINYWELDSDSD